MAKDLTTFKALSFDCFGTLVDWKSGLEEDLQPLLGRLPAEHPMRRKPSLAVVRFNELSDELWQSQPKQLYPANLSASYRSLAAEAGVTAVDDDDELAAAAEHVGTGPGRWAAFPDTVAGLLRLARHYKLVILSNVDNANIARTVAGALAPARFDAVYTAEDIGSYKPDLANFRYLFDHARAELGVDRDRGDLLHVAVGLAADHVPAKKLGLRGVWIARGADVPERYESGVDVEQFIRDGKLAFEWKFQTIGEFADEVDRQFAQKG